MVLLSKMIERYPSLKDLIDYLKRQQVGSYLPGERTIADAVGWNRCTIRENMRTLEPYGHVEIQHGKRTKYVKPF